MLSVILTLPIALVLRIQVSMVCVQTAHRNTLLDQLFAVD
jgi:hypothetical protein